MFAEKWSNFTVATESALEDGHTLESEWHLLILWVSDKAINSLVIKLFKGTF